MNIPIVGRVLGFLMFFIVLSLAILPLAGVGGTQLYNAEVPGPVPDKMAPRVRQTAKALWGVYVLLSGRLEIYTVLVLFTRDFWK